MFQVLFEFPTTTALCCAAATIGVARYERRRTSDGIGRTFWTCAVFSAATLSVAAWLTAMDHAGGSHGLLSTGAFVLLIALALSYVTTPFGAVSLAICTGLGAFRRTDGARWGPTARAAAVFAANVGAFVVVLAAVLRAVDD